MDIVRAGITTYGMYPSDEVEKERVPLKPAMELISHVAHVKWLTEGKPVSYGGTYVTTRPTKVATIPVGYGDGYPRSLSNKRICADPRAERHRSSDVYVWISSWLM